MTALLELYRDPTDGLPYVEVSRGREKVLARWDSGVATTLVDAAWAAEHPAFFDGELLAETRVGGASFSPCAVEVVDLTETNAELAWPSPIILGMSFIGQARWVLDFPAAGWSVEA